MLRNSFASKESKKNKVTLDDVEYTSLYRGKRNYELSNHLGNVQVVISDKRISICDGLDVESFKADVLAAMDYYPFGMMMPDRQWYAGSDSSSYPFGFQRQERDDETKGAGNSISYKYRIHDTRLGRFFSVDPLSAKYAYNSPYAFSENRVIDAVELEGLEVVIIGSQVQGAVVLSGSATGGIVWNVATGQIYAMSGWALGIETNASIGAGISITTFPTMTDINDAAGMDMTVSVSTEWGPLISAGAVVSSKHTGLNVVLGVSLGFFPVSGSYMLGSSSMRPFTTKEEYDMARSIVSKALCDLHDQYDDKLAVYQHYFNTGVSHLNEIDRLTGLMNATNDPEEKERYQTSIDAQRILFDENMKKTLASLTALENIGKTIAQVADVLIRLDEEEEKLVDD